MIAAFLIPDAGCAERPRVLLADDHPAVLALTATVLADECLVVGRVGDGYELLAEAERLHPDVIVLDITMPRLDGIAAGPRQWQRWICRYFAGGFLPGEWLRLVRHGRQRLAMV